MAPGEKQQEPPSRKPVIPEPPAPQPAAAPKTTGDAFGSFLMEAAGYGAAPPAPEPSRQERPTDAGILATPATPTKQLNPADMAGQGADILQAMQAYLAKGQHNPEMLQAMQSFLSNYMSGEKPSAPAPAASVATTAPSASMYGRTYGTPASQPTVAAPTAAAAAAPLAPQSAYGRSYGDPAGNQQGFETALNTFIQSISTQKSAAPAFTPQTVQAGGSGGLGQYGRSAGGIYGDQRFNSALENRVQARAYTGFHEWGNPGPPMVAKGAAGMDQFGGFRIAAPTAAPTSNYSSAMQGAMSYMSSSGRQTDDSKPVDWSMWGR